MARNSDIPRDSFDAILAWLSPDRDTAACLYLDLRHALAKIFAWNHCIDPEGMTDETIDRVARQVHRLRDSFEGNPNLFFYGVANNLIKEYRKKINLHIPIDNVELPEDPPQEAEEETSDIREECLQACLQELTSEKRELILAYYAKEKQAKIAQRMEMAKRFGISIETLRVRMCRIRASLEECIEHRLERLALEK